MLLFFCINCQTQNNKTINSFFLLYNQVLLNKTKQELTMHYQHIINFFSIVLILSSISCNKQKVTQVVKQKPHVISMEVQITNTRKQISANPSKTQLWKTLGNLYYDTNNPKEAIKAYNQYLFFNENDANAWTDLGVMYRRDKNPLEAIKCFEKANAIEPTHQQSLFNKGIVLYYDLKDKSGAINAWDSLVKINPEATTPKGMKIKDFIKQIEIKSKKN